jgi:hypothetical protein
MLLAMRGVLLIGIAACGFTGPSAAVAVDASEPIDAPPVCSLSPGTSTPSTMNLGETMLPLSHGTAQPPLVCMSGELPIFIGLAMTPGAVTEGGNEPVATGITVQCGTMGFTADGSISLALKETVKYTSAGGCADFMPPTVLSSVACPLGQVAVGLTGNGGASSLFNHVAVSCARVSMTASVAASTTAVQIPGSGTNINNLESAQCPAGTALVSFQLRSDCGLDDLTPVCAPLACK